jgi:glycosyltransferase involved in cell wall biosynthesis
MPGRPADQETVYDTPGEKADSMTKISAYIIAFNEAEKIEQAVGSVLWADEIIVADSGSRDETAAIAERMGARVVQIPFEGFGELRNKAIAACTHEWILSVDADERCTPEVRDEILLLLAAAPAHDAYLVPRRNYFMGRWIRHSGWYPNYRQPQLFRKGSMSYTSDVVHEGYIMHDGRTLGRLANDIWQFPFRNLEEVNRKMTRYSTLGAQKMQGRRVTMTTAFTHAVWAFFKHFFLQRGFLDGWAGFVIAFGHSEGAFYRYAKRVEADSGWQLPSSPPLNRPKT